MTRRAWGRAVLVVLVVGLPLGRWLALRTADRAWAESMGVSATHGDIASLRLAVTGLAFLAAAAWALGNLYLVYRSIGSVHVPRRLGNIEISEAVPRRYLQIIMLALAAAVATALSVGAGEWWREFALVGVHGATEVRDPILGRELGYYLFTLPWQHRVITYLTRLVGVVLALTALLHGLIGAVRWADARLETTDLARAHLATQLVVFASVLFLGFRLDPAKYVAGLHGVPYDAILVDVRLPVAALLSGLALAAGLTSLLWVRVPRAVVAGVPWAALALVGIVGTYLVPGFAAAARSPDQRARADLVEAQGEMLGHAFGAIASERVIDPPPSPDPAVIARHNREIAAVPVWDPPILQGILAGAAGAAYDTSDQRWTTPALSVYWSATAGHVPAFVTVRERDLLAARQTNPDLSWREAHAGARAFGSGADAVLAGAASETGMPLYVPDVARPDSVTPMITALALGSERIAFSPAAEPFAITDSASMRRAGLRVRGAGRRLALAWALQSPQLLSRGAVPSGQVLLWPRGIVQRLERLAPFARFGAPYPAIVTGRVLWLAPGYITADAFPLSVAVEFAGGRVRAARAGFVGTVDAHDGATAVYLLPQADPLSEAWAALAPDIVQPATRLPADVATHVRYPEELFHLQLPLVLVRGAEGLPVPARRGARERGVDADLQPVWLPAAAVGGPPGSLALHAVTTVESGAVEALVDGIMENARPELEVIRLRTPVPPGEGRPVEGVLGGRKRILAFAEGLVTVVPVYLGDADGTNLPRLGEVAVETGGVAGRGSTLGQAVARLQAALGAPPAGSAQWVEARRWFERMDQARRTGDWTEFGRAWQELRRLLGVPRDSTPSGR